MTYAPTLLDALVLTALRLGTPADKTDETDARPQTTATADAASATLARAQRGQADAKAALVRELQDVWYRFALSILRDPEQAKDAAQETALRFLKGLERFRGDSQVKTWSLGIANNVCRERLRKRKHQPLGLSEHIIAPDETPGPHQRAELREQRGRLLAVLGDLPLRQREAVVLRYFEQLSVKETARVMGCAQGTVKATLSQAIRSLRTRLEVGHD